MVYVKTGTFISNIAYLKFKINLKPNVKQIVFYMQQNFSKCDMHCLERLWRSDYPVKDILHPFPVASLQHQMAHTKVIEFK